jgi:hypothetical protein
VTRKDYIVIANAIRNFRPFVRDDNDYLLLVNLFCSELKEENIRFDRSKFMAATGIE